MIVTLKGLMLVRWMCHCARGCRIAVATVAAVCAVVRGGGGPAADSGPALAIVQRMPERASVVLAIPSGERMLDEASGQGKAVGLLVDSINQTSSAWPALAKALGWSPEESLRALLGGALVITLEPKDVEPAAGAAPARLSWALVAMVTPATKARLEQKLAPLPKEIIAGQPVLSVENGHYALVMRPVPPAMAAAASGERTVMLLIGPADGEESGLFRAWVEALGLRGEARGGAWTGAKNINLMLTPLRASGLGWMALMVRASGEAERAGDEAWAGWGAHRLATIQGDELNGVIEMRVRDGGLRGMRGVPALAHGAIVAMVGEGMIGAYQRVLSGVKPALGIWMMHLVPEMPLAPASGDESRAVCLRLSARGTGPGAAGVQAWGAVSAVGTAEDRAMVDRAVRRMGEWIEGVAGGAGAADGAWDQAMLSARLAGGAQRETTLAVPTPGLAGAIIGGDPPMRWGFVAGSGAGSLGWPGWFTASLGSADGVLRAPAVIETDGRARRYVSVGWIHLIELADAVPALKPFITAPNAAGLPTDELRAAMVGAKETLSLVDGVTWSMWLSDDEDGVVVGELRTTVRPKPK